MAVEKWNVDHTCGGGIAVSSWAEDGSTSCTFFSSDPVRVFSDANDSLSLFCGAALNELLALAKDVLALAKLRYMATFSSLLSFFGNKGIKLALRDIVLFHSFQQLLRFWPLKHRLFSR